jgi:hypothetical protein
MISGIVPDARQQFKIVNGQKGGNRRARRDRHGLPCRPELGGLPRLGPRER